MPSWKAWEFLCNLHRRCRSPTSLCHHPHLPAPKIPPSYNTSCRELKVSLCLVRFVHFSWAFPVGTPKYLANKMKSKGLQRLRWYCQVCQKQCRDANGFKCHTQSEAHLRQMLVVGENAGRHIADYSSQFQHDFVQLLSRRCAQPPFMSQQFFIPLIGLAPSVLRLTPFTKSSSKTSTTNT